MITPDDPTSAVATALPFYTADVVQLKSGGPRMTFTGQTADGRMLCIWFDKTHVNHVAGFPPACLVPAKPVGGTGGEEATT